MPTACATTLRPSRPRPSSGNSNRTFVRVFHTVSSGSDDDRWRHFRTPAPANRMIPKSDRNSQGSSKESRSLLVFAGRRMVKCHPKANGHASNRPETAQTEPKGAEANRTICKPEKGSDAKWLAGAVDNRRNSNETHPEKRNSRMIEPPGGEPARVILANSRRRSDFATTPPE